MSEIRVRVPETFPRERLVLGELYLVRSRLDRVLDEIGTLLRQSETDEAWPRVEEAARPRGGRWWRLLVRCRCCRP